MCKTWVTQLYRFDNDFKLLRRKGTLVSVGNASGAVPPFPPLKLAEKNIRLLRPTYASVTYDRF